LGMRKEPDAFFEGGWGTENVSFVLSGIRGIYSEQLILAMNSGMMMTGAIKGPKAQDPAFHIIFGGQYG
jgi:hypothetical protein